MTATNDGGDRPGLKSTEIWQKELPLVVLVRPPASIETRADENTGSGTMLGTA